MIFSPFSPHLTKALHKKAAPAPSVLWLLWCAAQGAGHHPPHPLHGCRAGWAAPNAFNAARPPLCRQPRPPAAKVVGLLLLGCLPGCLRPLGVSGRRLGLGSGRARGAGREEASCHLRSAALRIPFEPPSRVPPLLLRDSPCSRRRQRATERRVRFPPPPHHHHYHQLAGRPDERGPPNNLLRPSSFRRRRRAGTVLCRRRDSGNSAAPRARSIDP